MILTFTCTNQSLIRTDNNILAANSMNYVFAEFKFDDTWKGFTASAIFEKSGIAYEVVLDQLNSCIVPEEVLKDSGWFSVSLKGVTEDTELMQRRATTKSITIGVSDGPCNETANPGTPTLEITEQLTALYGEAVETASNAVNIANSVKAAAEAGEYSGKDGAPGKDGEQGEKGEKGDTPTIEIGTVKSLGYHATPTVKANETETGISLDFGIPKGSPGHDGASVYAFDSLDTLYSTCYLYKPNVEATATIQFVWISDREAAITLTADGVSTYYILQPGVFYNLSYISTAMATSVEYTAITAGVDLNGKKGDTPQKGVDYFTAEDRQSIVSDVLSALPVWEGGSY